MKIVLFFRFMLFSKTLSIERVSSKSIKNLTFFLGALVERVVHDFLDISSPLKQFTDTVLAPPQHPLESNQVGKEIRRLYIVLKYWVEN